MKIILNDLCPTEIEKVIDVWTFDECTIELLTENLSFCENDVCQNVNFSEFISNYLSGDKYVNSAMDISEEKFSNQNLLDQIDLAYRYEFKSLDSFFDLKNAKELIKYRRVFVIALKMGYSAWVDLFVEHQPKRWFTPILAELPDIENLIGTKATFDSEVLISSEKSAKKINNHYFIHEGTNKWNRAWLRSSRWNDKWEKQLKTWRNQFFKTETTIKELTNKDYCLLVVPEKDTLARVEAKDFNQSNMLPLVFTYEVSKLIDRNKFLFPVIELLEQNSLLRNRLPDSHLSGEDYTVIFKAILKQWGLLDAINKLSFSYDFEANYGDLGSKFSEIDGKRQIVRVMDTIEPDIVEGSQTFQNPLRDCYVKWENTEALIEADVLILGDSHCSIGGSPFLSYLFSRTFRSVTFFWNPYQLHELKVESGTKYDYVLSEISQRFINPSIESEL